VRNDKFDGANILTKGRWTRACFARSRPKRINRVFDHKSIPHRRRNLAQSV
jgi:hypothetical protein